jgi:hypothetical protein
MKEQEYLLGLLICKKKMLSIQILLESEEVKYVVAFYVLLI